MFTSRFLNQFFRKKSFNTACTIGVLSFSGLLYYNKESILLKSKSKVYLAQAKSLSITNDNPKSNPKAKKEKLSGQESSTKNKKKAVDSQPTFRERHFIAFASVEYDGRLYMTPQDFVSSITDIEPKYRRHRDILSKERMNDIIRKTPLLKNIPHQHLFRTLDKNGLISYSEFLFLLAIFTKPQSGFKIAFTMFDVDNNRKVNKKEFLVIREVLRNARILRGKLDSLHGESLYRYLLSSHGEAVSQADSDIEFTTLLTLFFGQDGSGHLTMDQFIKFIEDLQNEIFEIEFLEYSKGMPTITETEFGQALLRFTNISEHDYDEYLHKIIHGISEEHDIPMKDFIKFFQFLNSFDDFKLAIQMFTLADRQISEDEFQMAAKAVTGYRLNEHIVHTVFCLFDKDGNGHLLHRDLFNVISDRVNRGKFSPRKRGFGRWDAFKHCMNDLSHEV